MAVEPRPDAAATTRRLFDEHGRAVLAICRLTLRDLDEAEDAAQQTFLAAHRSLLRGTVPMSPGAWIAAIARNECKTRLRRSGSIPLPLNVERLAEAAEPVGDEAMSETLAELPRRQREAVVLRDVFGLSHAEIATALGVSGSAVNSLLTRGRGQLRARLGRARHGAPSLLVPDALRDQLVQLIPGFEATSAGTLGSAGAVGLLAKLASAPAAAKVTAVIGVAAVGASAPQLARHPAARSQSPTAAESRRAPLSVPVTSQVTMTRRPTLESRHEIAVRRSRGEHDDRGKHAEAGASASTTGSSHDGGRSSSGPGPSQQQTAEEASRVVSVESTDHGGRGSPTATEPENGGVPGPSTVSGTGDGGGTQGPGGGDAAQTPATVETHSGPGGGGGGTDGGDHTGSGSGTDG
jgi:RNA polymerase sigma-70 factor, ECF subfamily